MKKLFIIDGNSLVNRAFYALPLLADSNGVYSNAVFGFVNCLVKLITENNPNYLVVAFDHARKTFRNNIFDMYKGTRKETPSELRSQFPILKEVLKSMNITCIEQEGIEADDIVGTICKKSGCKNYIITGDRDSLQLVDNNTCVWLTQKGITDIKEVNINNIVELYELTPSQIVDFKALAGDSSDNIPGVAGIGEKTAKTLIAKYNNISGIYEHINELTGKTKEKIEQGKESCYMSHTLATIKTDCEFDFNLENCTYDFPFSNETRELFEKYSFKAVLKRENLFAEPEKTVELIEISSKTELINILNNFNGNYFAFNLKNDWLFEIDNKAYKINNNYTLLDLDPVYFEDIKACFSKILNNNNILKIVCDLKYHMHLFNLSKIDNVFDINLANYLISGGNKVEKVYNIGEYFAIYEEQLNLLREYEMEDLYFNIELPLVNVLYNMEVAGFKVDKQQLNELANDYGEKVKSILENAKECIGDINVNLRSPKQVATLLFDTLKLSDKGNKKHSTNEDSLNLIINEHPIVPLIIEFRKIQKLVSTYIEPYVELLKNDEIIHTVFNQTLTATGRLSSSEPNLQNIPVRSEEGKELRKIFISRFEGGKIISADYNQIELRLLANFSSDEQLLADYSKGSDIHSLTASQIFGKKLEDVTPIDRRMAKAVNFGIVYGISGFGLSKNIEISVAEAKRYINIYFEKYPRVKSYLDELIEFAKQNTYAKTIYNRRRYIPELSSNNGMLRQFGERVAMNMPLQGSASDFIKLAMLKVSKRLEKENLKSKLILQIHDELIIDTYPTEEEQVKTILTEEMESVYNFKVPLIVSVEGGNNLFECK